MLSCQIYVDGNNKIYLHLHVKCLTFLPDSIQIWTFMTDFHKSPLIKCHQICAVQQELQFIYVYRLERRTWRDMTWHDKANRCISWLREWAEQAHKNIRQCKAHSHLAAHPLCCGSCDCMWVSLLHWAAGGPDQILSHCGYRVCLQAALCHLLQLSWQNMTVHEPTSPDPPVLGRPPDCDSCQRVVVHAGRKYNITLIYLIQERIRGTLNPFPSIVFQKKLSLAGIRTKIGGGLWISEQNS